MNDFWKIVIAVVVLIILVGGSAVFTIKHLVLPLENDYKTLIASNEELQKKFDAVSLKRVDLLKQLKKEYADIEHDVLTAYINARTTNLTEELVEDAVNAIISKSIEHEIPIPFVVGIIDRESDFNTTAISKVKARGLMQIMPIWADEFNLASPKKFHIPEIGVDSGIKIYKQYSDAFDGNHRKALWKYNGSARSSWQFADDVGSDTTSYLLFRGKFLSEYEKMKAEKAAQEKAKAEAKAEVEAEAKKAVEVAQEATKEKLEAK